MAEKRAALDMEINIPAEDIGRLKIVLAAGGSGGHIFPCVALARELEKAGVKDIFFVSSARRLDRNLLKDIPFRRFFLSVNPMPRSFSPKRCAVFVLKGLWDLARSAGIILEARPDVVVGFGGYSSGAISLMAKLTGRRLVIHEQNVVPGRANIILSRAADLIALSFTASSRHFGRNEIKTVFTGNPIRTDMLADDRAASAGRMGISPHADTVLVMGGSQGSGFLNRIMLDVALEIKKRKGDAVQFVHITGGGRDLDVVERFYAENSIPGKVFGFMESIEDAYSVCDLAVSRSGAAAIFELAYYGKPMILVPYPNVRNSQKANASFFAHSGAAMLREEKDISREALTHDILSILECHEKRSSMREASLKMAFPDSGKTLAMEVLKTALLKRGKEQ
jgi:UDP-N-acetylglucosamine--N-acetylmuramyl-(pentapeptide) pyrophosphoryl-undecaprenol N-acetylglucosamine transferase